MRNTNANVLSAYLASGGLGCVIQRTKYTLYLNALRLSLRIRWNLKLQQLHISPSWTRFSAVSIVRSVFGPSRRFDGQTLKGRVTDAETKAERLLISEERTRGDNPR